MPVLKRQLELLTDEMTRQTCYQKYQQLLIEIQGDREIYERLNEYRKKNIALHCRKGSLQEEAMLETEYHALLHDSRVREFLFWEQKTLRMIRGIHQQVNETLSLDDSFLSEGIL